MTDGRRDVGFRDCRDFKNPRHKWSVDTRDTAARSLRLFRTRDRTRDPPLARICCRPSAICQRNRKKSLIALSIVKVARTILKREG